VAIHVAGQMARFDLLFISFVSSHFLMPNYDNNKLLERDLTCLTWHGDGEVSAKGIYVYMGTTTHICATVTTAS
jgi:hypothetical protein